MKNLQKIKIQKRTRRKIRTRTRIIGASERPRLNIFRSLRYLHVQIIDDEYGKTLLGISSKKLEEKGTKTEKAYSFGKQVAVKAMEQGIKSVVFDKNGYQYHGRIKAFAEGAREGGLEF